MIVCLAGRQSVCLSDVRRAREHTSLMFSHLPLFFDPPQTVFHMLILILFAFHLNIHILFLPHFCLILCSLHHFAPRFTLVSVSQSQVPGTGVPLCSAQCKRMFNSTRAPGETTGKGNDVHTRRRLDRLSEG